MRYEILPKKQASALSRALWLCLPKGRWSLMTAVSEIAASLIFCSYSSGFLYQLLWNSLKLTSDEIPASPETTPFQRGIHQLQVD